MGKHWTIKDTSKMKGRTPWNKGKKTGIVPKTAFKKGHKAPKTAFKKGQEPYNKGTKGLMKPNKTSFKKGQMLGENNVNWKGGITPKNKQIRNSTEYKLWRKACFERDNFTCQKTGISGGRLVVHHINNFAEFPELRLAIDNGITLSKRAHEEFHKIYGKKNNTKEQIIEFINN